MRSLQNSWWSFNASSTSDRGGTSMGEALQGLSWPGFQYGYRALPTQGPSHCLGHFLCETEASRFKIVHSSGIRTGLGNRSFL